MASRMSSTRIRQFLGGTDRLAEHLIAKLALQRLSGDEVDRPAEDLLEVLLDGEVLEEAHRTPEIDEQIDVAVRSGLVAGDGAEDGEGLDAHLGQLAAM